MLKQIWKNYYRYLKISRKESFLAFNFGILGAFFETFSIYLLANLITNLDIEKSIFKIKYLERDVAEFEPKLALNGGLDGLSEIRKVIKKSSELIKKNGKFILEIGFDKKIKVINLLNKEGFYIESTQKDIANNDRCIVSTKI